MLNIFDAVNTWRLTFWTTLYVRTHLSSVCLAANQNELMPKVNLSVVFHSEVVRLELAAALIRQITCKHCPMNLRSLEVGA